ncbi:MAG: glutamyl-tRNA reductase [Armatimonadota bacterium]|nr:glutamyl-tRNA reductase [Armatimonadota bacterium]
MHLVVIGLNHTTAPIDVRERLSVPESGLADALSRLKMCGCVTECCILSTCNRTEMYAVTESRDDDAVLIDFLSALTGVPKADFTDHLYTRSGHKAVDHLFRVSAGLDSMMLGEPQILGQVKSAYCVAGDCSCTGAVLNNLFQQALAVGKRARTETDIAKGAFSVGYAAVELANSIFGDLYGRRILIVGAGKMSENTAKRIISNGAGSVTVANRTFERARKLAEELGGVAVGFDALDQALIDADIVISSTGATEPIITRQTMAKLMRVRHERPVFLIDIAVPRDIEPEVGELDNVFLYNIDDLQDLVEQSVRERQKEIEKVELIIEQETRKFTAWLKTLEVVPLIRLLRERFDSIRDGEWEKYRGRLNHLNDRDRETVQALLQSVINKISHHPMVRIKDYANTHDGYGKMDVVRELFGVEITEEMEEAPEASAPEGAEKE